MLWVTFRVRAVMLTVVSAVMLIARVARAIALHVEFTLAASTTTENDRLATGLQREHRPDRRETFVIVADIDAHAVVTARPDPSKEPAIHV